MNSETENKAIMKKNTFIILAILTGLFFNSCKNNSSKNTQNKEDTAIKVKNDTSISDKETIKTDFVERSIDDNLAKKVKHYLNTTFLTEGDLRAITEDQRKFQLYKIDLNNDGKQEIFVNFITPYFCGTGGCTLLLLDNDLELITKFSPARNLYVEKMTQNGWSVLLTKTEGKWRHLIYKNGTYPSNPTIVEATNESPSKQSVILFDDDVKKSKTYDF